LTLLSLEAGIGVYAKWLKAHEKLILIATLAIVTWHFGEKIINAWDNHDKRIADIQQQKINADETANKALKEQLETLKAQVAIANAKADQAIATKHAETLKRQEVDANLPLPDLANRWSALLALSQGALTATSPDTVTVSNEAAHKTVNELEKIPDLQNNITQLQVKYDGCVGVTSKQTDVITGLNVQLSDEKVGRKLDAKVAADKQRKSWRSGFKWGYGAGIATVVAIKFAKFF
jgi:hypothetical protein